MPGLPYGTSESVEALYLHLVSRSLTLTRKTGESLVVPELVVQLTLSSKLGGARLLLGNTGSLYAARIYFRSVGDAIYLSCPDYFSPSGTVQTQHCLCTPKLL